MLSPLADGRRPTGRGHGKRFDMQAIRTHQPMDQAKQLIQRPYGNGAAAIHGDVANVDRCVLRGLLGQGAVYGGFDAKS